MGTICWEISLTGSRLSTGNSCPESTSRIINWPYLAQQQFGFLTATFLSRISTTRLSHMFHWNELLFASRKKVAGRTRLPCFSNQSAPPTHVHTPPRTRRLPTVPCGSRLGVLGSPGCTQGSSAGLSLSSSLSPLFRNRCRHHHRDGSHRRRDCFYHHRNVGLRSLPC